MAAIPGKSTVRDTLSSRDSRAANSVTATAITAIGGLMKKMARQLTCFGEKATQDRPDGERERADAGPGADRVPR